MKIYCAHSRLIYGSPLENYNIQAIRRILAHEPVIEIINPSELDQAIHTDTIMKRCLALVDDCDMLVFSTESGELNPSNLTGLDYRNLRYAILRSGDCSVKKQHISVVKDFLISEHKKPPR